MHQQVNLSNRHQLQIHRLDHKLASKQLIQHNRYQQLF